MAGAETDFQTQVDQLLATGGVFRVLLAAQFVAAHCPDLADWARLRFAEVERNADLLAEAFKLLTPAAAPTLPAPIRAVRPPVQPADPQTPEEVLNYLWRGVSNHKHRLNLMLDLVHHHPELRARFEQLTQQRADPPQAPPFAHLHPVADRAELRVLLDPELGRLAIGLRVAAPLRVWAVARHLVREGTGAGYVTRPALRAALASVNLGDRHLRRLLVEGEGVFWRSHKDRVYLCGVVKLAERLTVRALAEKPTLVLTNRPGVPPVIIRVDGGLADWETQLYTAWFYSRNDLTIARETLEMLFGRDADTLRRWEKHAPLKVRRNEVQCAENWQEAWDRLPPHARRYAAWTRQGTEIRLRWQIANSYIVSFGAFKPHIHRGQGAKVRKVVNDLVESYEVQPADYKRGGALRERLYFDTSAQLKRFSRWRRRHVPDTRRTVDDFRRPAEKQRYLWRGENRHGHGIFEMSTAGEYATYPNERLHPRTERLLLHLPPPMHFRGRVLP